MNSIKEFEQTITLLGLDYIQYNTVKRTSAEYTKHTYKQLYPIGSPFAISVMESDNGECKFNKHMSSRRLHKIHVYSTGSTRICIYY